MKATRNETPLMQKIQVFASYLGWRLFRNQVGTYKIMYDDGATAYISSGLCKGSSDLIGWRTVTVTPQMVGQKIAQFAAVEVKDGKHKAEDDQIKFIDAVRKAGGLAFVARSTEDVARETL